MTCSMARMASTNILEAMETISILVELVMTAKVAFVEGL